MRKSRQKSRQTGKPSTRRMYRRNYLKEVIARLDFEAPLPIPDAGPPKSFAVALNAQFPEPERVKQFVKQMRLSPEGMRERVLEQMDFCYYSRNRDKNVVLGTSYLLLHYRSYESFKILEQDFQCATEALFAVFPNTKVSRLGLRYVDHLEMNERQPTKWDAYITKHLLGCFEVVDDPATLARAFSILEFNYGDMRLRFQYGMPNPDFPATIKKKLFVLDWDAFCEQDVPSNELVERLQQFHKKVNASFEEVITDGLRKKMGVINGRR